ncbi:hypothetical protein MILUP08_45317 [Micromonospora lupini str. Lupac 08]|uniref:Uncharacterized protein n=1 Tax=Micromonospora lupini str. Lupac 08 TaxID=1150864 RepID=I0L9D8_9ACTN|nr:hypothetical protein MILUP08_45317 [Micromonospora lupini str. Lupac 08]
MVVLAADAHEVMAQLTRENDGTRPWSGVFVPIESQWPGTFGRGWAAEFTHRRHWTHLLDYLQSLPWPRPETVQVLIHDEEDDCFGPVDDVRRRVARGAASTHRAVRRT